MTRSAAAKQVDVMIQQELQRMEQVPVNAMQTRVVIPAYSLALLAAMVFFYRLVSRFSGVSNVVEGVVLFIFVQGINSLIEKQTQNLRLQALRDYAALLTMVENSNLTSNEKYVRYFAIEKLFKLHVSEISTFASHRLKDPRMVRLINIINSQMQQRLDSIQPNELPNPSMFSISADAIGSEVTAYQLFLKIAEGHLLPGHNNAHAEDSHPPTFNGA